MRDSRLIPTPLVLALLLFLGAGTAGAQHLWWDTEGMDSATCLYGEITVLATHPEIYYCGANWHPGEPAGGYCGIQHNGPRERRTIFSVWDTSPELHPFVTEADTGTFHERFGGEGEGSHTHMPWEWKEGETFRFYVVKTPGARPGTTDARYYVYDWPAKRWLHSATITSPDGDAKSRGSVATMGGRRIASFLENFGGTDQAVPKLALYRLWLGWGPGDLRCLTIAKGDGVWGTMGDAYFLAEGDAKALDTLFAGFRERYGAPVFGEAKKAVAPISGRPLPPELVKELTSLPKAPAVAPRR